MRLKSKGDPRRGHCQVCNEFTHEDIAFVAKVPALGLVGPAHFGSWPCGW